MPRVKESGIALSTFLQDTPPSLMVCPTPPSGNGPPLQFVSPYVPSPEEARATETSLRQLPRMRRSVSQGAQGVSLDHVSLAIVMTHLRDMCVMRGTNAVFCDVACGAGHAVLAAAEASPRMSGSLGFDTDKAAILVAQKNADAFQRVWWNGAQYYPLSASNDEAEPTTSLNLLARDVCKIDSLGCSTHVYAFCPSMPAHAFEHVLRVCASTPTVRYLILVYDEKDSDVRRFVEAAKGVTVRTESFVSARGRSQLKMTNGRAANGCVIRVRSRIRQMLEEWSAGVFAETPSHSHLGSLPELWVLP